MSFVCTQAIPFYVVFLGIPWYTQAVIHSARSQSLQHPVSIHKTTRTYFTVQTPIDSIEDIINGQEWPYERVASDEIIAEISGQWCEYRLMFLWQEENNILHISCYMDIPAKPERLVETSILTVLVNETLALGHFEITSESSLPAYRYSSLFQDGRLASPEYIEELIEIALSECERFYPAFQFVILSEKTAREAVAVALLDTAGEA